jgi:Patatin-like phospholipase
MSPVGATSTRLLTQGVQYVTTSFWVCIFSLVSASVAPGILMGLPQGQELLNTITDDQVFPFAGRWEGPLHYALFLAGLLAWGLANWYGSRLLMQRDYMMPRDEKGVALTNGFRPWWNLWFPRLLGGCGIFLIALYIVIGRTEWLAGAGVVAVLAIFLAFVIYRRQIFRVTGSPMGRAELSTADRVALWLSLSLAFVLLIFLGSINWYLARFLGVPVILFLGLGSLVLVGAVVLTYLPLAYGWPALTWAPLILAFVFGLTNCNRNHAISKRLLSGADLTSPRPDVVEHFARWLKSHPTGPIYLVAAEGGASRSGWWSSHVLTVLDYATDGEFSRRVYAVSGVSGGSLGAATYVVLLAERVADVRATKPLQFPTQDNCWAMRYERQAFPLPMQSECFLERDVLSTTGGYLLFPDLLQRLLSWRVYGWDRSRGLEDSWQIDWRTLFERSPEPGGPVPNPFAETLETLYLRDGKVRDDIPLLFLNSTRAELGRSVLQSPVSIESAELDDLFDARLLARGLPLSDAVHNSARFPIVSPGGDVETSEHKYWDALVDGGYFENSGAATLAELIRDLENCANRHFGPPCKLTQEAWAEALPRIHVLFILNDPDRDRSVLSPGTGPADPLFADHKPLSEEELLTPLAGLYDSRGARGDSSKRFLLSLLPKGEDGSSPATEIFLLPHPKHPDAPPSTRKLDEPAMSWYLNPTSRLSMWAAVDAQRDKICALVTQVAPAHATACPGILDQFRITGTSP